MSGKSRKNGKKTKTRQQTKQPTEENQDNLFVGIKEKTGFSDETVRSHYAVFIKICPNGMMTKKTFLELSRVALGDQVNFLSDSLFRVFDKDKNGTMDFGEYMLALKATSHSLTPEDKLRWIFDVFDKDGGGTISANEVELLIDGLFKMSGHETEEEDLKEACKDIMDTIDSDGDGEITKKEFIANALNSPFIAGILT